MVLPQTNYAGVTTADPFAVTHPGTWSGEFLYMLCEIGDKQCVVKLYIVCNCYEVFRLVNY